MKNILLIMILLCAIAVKAQVRPAVQYVGAKDIIAMSKASAKPYTWVVVYVPKCARAAENFDAYMKVYKPNADKVQLVLLSILTSTDNQDSVAKFSALHQFETPLYVMDSSYREGGIRETPERYLKDMTGLLHTDNGFYEHIIIDRNGKLVYKSETLDFDAPKLRKYLK